MSKAQVILKKGDRFSFLQENSEKRGTGIFLGNGKALLVKGDDALTGWSFERTSIIPGDLLPIEDDKSLHYDIKLILKAVSYVISD